MEQRAQRFRQARKREEEAIAQLSDRIGAELEKSRQVSGLESDIATKKKQVKAYSEDRSKLVAKGNEQRVARLNAVMEAADKVRGFLRFFSSQEQSLLALQDEVQSLRQNEAPEMLRRSQERHAASRLKTDDWDPFKIDYTGDVDTQIEGYLKACRSSAKRWRGTTVPQPENPEASLIETAVNLEQQPLGLLESETTRLQNLVNADKVTQQHFRTLSEKVTAETAAQSILEERLKDAMGAKERANTLQKDREDAYQRVFDAIWSEQQVLIDLYAPLMDRLADTTGSLQKMSFRVSRKVDISAWAARAEENLLDLRRLGAFKGQGTLLEKAESILLDAWQSGNATVVKTAMEDFRSTYHSDLLQHATVSRSEMARNF